MKKILTILLSIAILLTSSPSVVFASQINGTAIISPGPSTGSADALFAIRAQLIRDSVANAEEITKIEAQLSTLGVEKITALEVGEKLGITAHPLYEVYSTSDTSWFSERWVTVWNGQQYEIQIITGQANNSSSPLYVFEDTAHKNFSGQTAGSINAVQVIAESIHTGSISAVLPTVGTALSVLTTLYDIMKAYDSGLSPFHVIDDADFSADIYLSTTMKFAFAKSYGALDVGNQILVYAGNRVDYSVYIDIPTFIKSDGTSTPCRYTIEKTDYSESYAFNNSKCISESAKNYWNFRQGDTNLAVHHDIREIPFVILDSVYIVDIPYEFAYIREV